MYRYYRLLPFFYLEPGGFSLRFPIFRKKHIASDNIFPIIELCIIWLQNKYD